jgi:hypothetical protein
MRSRQQDPSLFSGLLVWLLILITVISAIAAPGMQEMATWQRWLEMALAIDPVFAFRSDPNAYPPGAVSLLFMSSEFLNVSDSVLSIKILLLCASVGTSIATGLWLRSWPMAWLSLGVCGYVGVSLGLLDALYLFPLTLALWALSKGRFAFFSFFFATAIMIKWQPAIIAPLILIYLVRKVLSRRRCRSRVSMILEATMPGLIVVFVTIFVFGPSYMIDSLSGATQQNMWSGNALNLNWLLSALVIGSEGDWGSVTYLYVDDVENPLPTIMKLIFWFSYVALLLLISRVRNLDFERLMVALSIAILFYGLVAVGAHSNHMTLIIPVSIYLIQRVAALRYQAILLLAIPLVNLVWDMGLTGNRLPIPSLGPIDASIPIAVFIVVIGGWLAFHLLQFLLTGQPDDEDRAEGDDRLKQSHG